jgi:subtilase family serine protease
MKKQWILIAFTSLFLIAAGACQQQEEEPLETTEAMPDLAVSDVSCMGGNLYISIINQGEAGLPEEWHGVMSLYIDGANQEDIVLEEPTSMENGGIAEPGGISRFLIPYDIPQPVRVDLYVDYAEQIDESNEENNSLENEFIGPCLLPDLTIEDIYLDENCQVVAVVKNLGPGSVPQQLWQRKEMPECTLKLFLNEEEYCVRTFFEFDPEEKLAPVEGTAAFPSDMKITEESTVTAVIDCLDIVNEQNKDNNTMTKTLNCEK